MITKHTLSIREKIQAELVLGRYPSTALSGSMFTELLDHCTPTMEEFKDMTTGCLMGADTLYRLIMEAPHNWRDAHPIEGDTA